jgi:predicted RNA polymerase sigma factor
MKLKQVPYIIAATFVFAISVWTQDETPQNATAWYGYGGRRPETRERYP